MKISLVKIREYLFYWLLFLLPWQTRWIIYDPLVKGEVWEYGRISLYGWDIVAVVLLLFSWRLLIKEVGLLVENLKIKYHSDKLKFFQEPLVFYLLFLIYAGVAISWSSAKIISFVWLLRLVEVGWLWLIVKAIKPRLVNLAYIFTVVGLIQAVWASGQFMTQYIGANKWLGVAEHYLYQSGSSVILAGTGRWLRAYGGQVHPNVLGGLLVVSLLFTVYLRLKLSKSYKSISSAKLNSQLIVVLLTVAYVVQLGALFFSFSRGAWLAWFVSITWWYYKDRSNRFVAGKVVGLSLLVFLSLGSVLWQPTMGRLLGGSRLEQQSVEERVNSAGEIQQLAYQHQWQGVGWGAYTMVLQKYQPQLKAYQYQPAHNLWLLILTELGIIGLVLFMILWWLAERRSRSIVVYLLAGPLVITSLFDHYWWTIPSMFLLFWLLIFGLELEE